MKKRLILCGILEILLFTQCNHRTTATIVDPYIKSLVKRRAGSTFFYISLPSNYVIQENRARDFAVYYFGPVDTTDHKSFAGGFYLGNVGSLFATDEADSCKMNEIQGVFMGEKVKWEYNTCTNHVFVQKLINIKGAEHWPRQIHAFGNALDTLEAKKLMLIFSTLYQESK